MGFYSTSMRIHSRSCWILPINRNVSCSMQNAELQFLVHMCVAVLPTAFSMLLMMGSSRVWGSQSLAAVVYLQILGSLAGYLLS